MQDTNLKKVPEKGKSKETRELSIPNKQQLKQPLSENHFKLKQFILSAIDETVNVTKAMGGNLCQELVLQIEEKLRDNIKICREDVDKKLLEECSNIERWATARLYTPVFWYLTLSKLKQKNEGVECVHEALITSNTGSGSNAGLEWKISKETEDIIQTRKESIDEEKLAEYSEYFEANIARFGVIL